MCVEYLYNPASCQAKYRTVYVILETGLKIDSKYIIGCNTWAASYQNWNYGSWNFHCSDNQEAFQTHVKIFMFEPQCFGICFAETHNAQYGDALSLCSSASAFSCLFLRCTLSAETTVQAAHGQDVPSLRLISFYNSEDCSVLKIAGGCCTVHWAQTPAEINISNNIHV